MTDTQLTTTAVATPDQVIEDGAWREVALSDQEYELIVALLGRTPRPVELGMFGAMWSEHCGYKHTRPLLKTLPTQAPWVVQGPGENAGAVDVGDGLAAVFKVESHNHPSAVEPREGAATGVGGIVRDIFTMGARPIALLDSLRFGSLDEPRTHYLFSNVVAGIGGYGNCLGIPTVGGEVFFDPSFNGNPLVNAMCVGIVAHDQLTRATASGPGNIVVLIGAETGRDGLHGATFSSVDDPEQSHRGVVQVGNPFLEKLLLEACLELLEAGDIVAMQDLGAAGLTSSLVECASRGGVGAEIDVALVPRREPNMNAYEVMLSESQERMLLVVPPEALERTREIVNRWSLSATAIGTITADGVLRIRDQDRLEVDVPAHLFTDACPTYQPEASEDPQAIDRRAITFDVNRHSATADVAAELLALLASPNIASRRPVYQQYDHTILTNTVVAPGEADAAVVRLRGTDRALALAIDCNPRYCELDPYLGAQLAVAEATRNVSCTGARPLGITNGLNFGNPQRPAGMYQLKQAVMGLGAAARALGVPVVSGNVSLYNESAGRPIMPNPTIGVVGVLDNLHHHATMRWEEGQEIALIGAADISLNGSEFAALKGHLGGTPATWNPELEANLQSATRSLIASGIVTTAHDCGLGGLTVALAEMALASDIGFALHSGRQNPTGPLDWFGEGPSRIVIAYAPSARSQVIELCQRADIPTQTLGQTGGTVLDFGRECSVPIDVAREAYERTLAGLLG